MPEIASILLAETVNDGETVNRQWLKEEWLRRHPEAEEQRVMGYRNRGLMGTQDISVALRTLDQAGIITRSADGTYVAIVDRTALAAFAEAVRSALRR